MRKPALDGNGQFPWDKLIVDEPELILHLQDSIRVGEFGRRCVGCHKWCFNIEDDVCDSCWERVQRAIE